MELARRPPLPCPLCRLEIDRLRGRGDGVFLAEPCGHQVRVEISEDPRHAHLRPAHPPG